MGREAREAKRVEVPFESIAPPAGKLWSASATDGPAPSTPAVEGGTVYVCSYDGRLYALNAESGLVMIP